MPKKLPTAEKPNGRGGTAISCCWPGGTTPASGLLGTRSLATPPSSRSRTVSLRSSLSPRRPSPVSMTSAMAAISGRSSAGTFADSGGKDFRLDISGASRHAVEGSDDLAGRGCDLHRLYFVGALHLDFPVPATRVP